MPDYQLEHTYTSGCPVVLATARDGDQIAMALVELTGCPDAITATVAADPDDPTGRTVIVTWDNADQGTVSVRWDGLAAIPAQPATGSLPHVYTAAQDGIHTVTIADEDDPNRSIIVDFETPLAPPPGPLALRVEPDTPDGYTARAIWGPDTPPPGGLSVQVTPGTGDGYTATASWTRGE